MLFPKSWPRFNFKPFTLAWEQVDLWLASAVLSLIMLAGLMIRSTGDFPGDRVGAVSL
jgi:hypothetical protein